MILGNPDKFAIIMEVVSAWNIDQSFNNGVLIFSVDGKAYPSNQEDKAGGYVTEAPVPIVEIFNTTDYGEEFYACLISKEEFVLKVIGILKQLERTYEETNRTNRKYK